MMWPTILGLVFTVAVQSVINIRTEEKLRRLKRDLEKIVATLEEAVDCP